MKDKIITYTFISYLLLFSSLGLIFKDQKISTSERRTLSTFPNIEYSSEFITKVDKYFLDHFPYREEFRTIKATYNYKFLKKIENNGIYIKDNYIFKSIYPTNEKSLLKFQNHIKEVSKMFPNSNTYLLIIPDKNYYLDDKYFLNIDYDYIYKTLSINPNFIDIRDTLSLSDYYRTDTHWRQESLPKVVEKLSNQMGFDHRKTTYKKNIYPNFKGIFASQSALYSSLYRNNKGEDLIYLTNNELDNTKVTYLENKNLSSIYNKENLNSLDPYNVFLDGPSSYIEILNNNVAQEEKKLIIFRDSFASSLVPLLVPYYHKITLIDNRYIAMSYLDKELYKEDSDVLFLYSTLLVNESFSLKN